MDILSPVTKWRAAQSKSNRAEWGPNSSCTSSNIFLWNSHLWLPGQPSNPDGLYQVSLGNELKGNLSAECYLQTSTDSAAFIIHYHMWGRETSVAFIDLISGCLSRQSFPVIWRFDPKIFKISLHQLKYFFFRKNIVLNTASLQILLYKLYFIPHSVFSMSFHRFFS